ncbi:MAG: glycerate kinase, partial [Anaerolineae bacterium]|nr:glycerate kinase [Anaerolineae bacterium]
IRAALEHGARRLLIGIGGSATNDGGAGCAEALGFKLLDESGQPISPGGAGLAQLARIDGDEARRWLDSLGPLDIRVLSDVTNPLTGPDGATTTFARQKGATDDMLPFLDANLAHLANVMRRDLGVDVEHAPGAGAAGGLGAGLMAFLGAQLAPGGAVLIDLLGYADKLAGCDVVITGEGALDAQTSGGKGVQRIAEAAAGAGVPVIALVGALKADPGALRAMGILAAWSIVPGPMALSDALRNAEAYLTRAATMVGNMLATAERR